MQYLNINRSRRWFLKAAAIAPAVVTAAEAAAAAPAPEPSGPLTPEGYIAAMEAIGWRVEPQLNRKGEVEGVSEHCDALDEDQRLVWEIMPKFFKIGARVPQPHGDFFIRVGRIVLERREAKL